MHTTKQHAKHGLTLVEVILAAAILGIGLTVLLTAASRCLAVMKQAKRYQTALWTLNMGEVEYPVVATNELEDLNVDGHEFDNGFTFYREVEEDDGDEEDDGLHIVRTRVTWKGRGTEMAEEVVHYVYREPEDE